MRSAWKSQGVLVALLACVSTAVFGIEVSAQQGYPPELLKPPAAAIPSSAARPLVVIRYPVAVDPAAHDLLVQRYAIDDRYFEMADKSRADPATFDLALIETAYYGALLERCMRHELPTNVDILLEPTMLTKDDANVVSEKGPATTVPASLVVDFFAYTSPGQFHFLVDTEHTTFANYLLPMFAMRAPHEALPATRGAVAGSSYLIGLLTNHGGSDDPSDARSGDRATLPELLNMSKRSAPSASKGLPANALIKARPWKPGAFLGVHSAWFTMDFDKEVGEGNWGHSDFCSGISLTAQDALAYLLQTPTVETRRLGSYARNFDAGFADRVRAAATTADDAERLTTVKAFYQAEMSYLARDDKALSDATLIGPWADEFRKARVIQVDERLKAKHDLKMALWHQTLSSLAATAASLPLAGLVTVMQPVGRNDAKVSAQAAAANDATRLPPTVLEVGGVRQEIPAQSLSELRAALKQAWSHRFPQ